MSFTLVRSLSVGFRKTFNKSYYSNSLPTNNVLPIISGVQSQNQTLTVSNGGWFGSVPITYAYQWKRSGVNISGATSNTYVLQSADVGTTITATITATNSIGVATATSIATNIITSTYALGDPRKLTTLLNSTPTSSVKQIETATFTASGKPLMITVATRKSVATEASTTITYGTPGRTFGTGTSAGAYKYVAIRGSTELKTFFILNPGSGNISIQMDSTLAYFSAIVSVIEIGFAKNLINSTFTNSNSITSRGTSITTTTLNSGVMHYYLRSSGDPTNPLSLTGVESIIENIASGVDVTNDITLAIGYEKSATTGVYASTASWPTASLINAMATEVTSN